MNDDADLVRRLQRGDDAAWSYFYDSLAGDIRGYVARLGAKSPDDVLGETMVQIVRDVGRFAGSSEDLRRWSFTIARNRTLDDGRRRARRVVETTLDPGDDVDGGEVGVDAVGPLEDGDLANLLAGLTPSQREAVWLRHVVGLSVDETATVMDKAPDAVAALTLRALRRLRRSQKKS